MTTIGAGIWREADRAAAVPQLVHYVAPCPAGHPAAEWTARREDTRGRVDVSCAICTADLAALNG